MAGKSKVYREQAQEEAEASRSESSVVDYKQLWAAVTDADLEIEMLNKGLVNTNFRKSDLLKQIVAVQGHGPFQAPGLGLVSIRSRKAKVEGEEPIYFFVTVGARPVTVIE